MTDTRTGLHDLVATLIRNWGPESPDEPGAADGLADVIIKEVLDANDLLAAPWFSEPAPAPRRATEASRLTRAAERIATIIEQDYLDRRGRGTKLPTVRP